MSIEPAILKGENSLASGTIVHAVDYSAHAIGEHHGGAALCGRKPRPHSTGWLVTSQRPIACPKCRILKTLHDAFEYLQRADFNKSSGVTDTIQSGPLTPAFAMGAASQAIAQVAVLLGDRTINDAIDRRMRGRGAQP